MQLLLAGVLSSLFTLLISPIEIRFRAKTANFSACWGSAFWLYWTILALGNLIGALLAVPMLEARLPLELAPVSSLMSAFAGVFAFQGVLSNTNVTVFGKGMLTIDDWIERARSSAVADALEKSAMRSQDEILRSADAIARLPEAQLNGHLLRLFGDDNAGEKLAKITQRAHDSGADEQHYKALVLATQFPSEAAALVRNLMAKAAT